MSNSSGGGWWQASDGNWYPPEQHPAALQQNRLAPEVVHRAAADVEARPRGSRRKTVMWSVGIIVGLGVLGNLVPDDEQEDATSSLAASAVETSVAVQPEASAPKPPTTAAAPTTTAPPRTTTTIDPAVLRKIDMQGWVTDNSGLINEVTDALNEVTEAASDYDIFKLNTACLGLRGKIMEAQRVRAIPEPAVNDPWQKALAAYKLSAETCITGAQNVDAALLKRSATYTNEATRHLQDATAALSGWMAKNGL